MKIEVKLLYDAIKIKFNGITHLHLNANKLIGYQSWRETYGNCKYVIEYTLDGGCIKCEYDTEAVWIEVLSKLDAALGGDR